MCNTNKKQVAIVIFHRHHHCYYASDLSWAVWPVTVKIQPHFSASTCVVSSPSVDTSHVESEEDLSLQLVQSGGRISWSSLTSLTYQPNATLMHFHHRGVQSGGVQGALWKKATCVFFCEFLTTVIDRPLTGGYALTVACAIGFSLWCVCLCLCVWFCGVGSKLDRCSQTSAMETENLGNFSNFFIECASQFHSAGWKCGELWLVRELLTPKHQHIVWGINTDTQRTALSLWIYLHNPEAEWTQAVKRWSG